MSVKKQVLATFENNKGKYLSGAEIAEELSVSRNAVWKAVKSLQEEGYNISAITNKGYCLDESTDILSPQSISKHLPPELSHYQIQVHKVTTSTFNILRQLAQEGAPEGIVAVAEEQTAGKGRMSRSFFSPTGTGVYMGILLRPKIAATEALFITTSAAVAVAQAIEAVSKHKAQIKWVNDIFVNNKKACGILTEAAFDLETQNLDYAILGIGINVKQPAGGFPPEIQDVATAILDEHEVNNAVRSQLIAEVLKNFWYYYTGIKDRKFLKEYQQRSFLVGTHVWVLEGDKQRKALVLGITDNCELQVRFEDDNTIENLSTGEVSIKPIF